jgi:uncharacterized membrane protein HdeD (DUF308 family)
MGKPMTDPAPALPHAITGTRWRRARGGLVLLMGCLAILAPFVAGTLALFVVGLLLIACGVLEMLETYQADDETGRRSAYLGGMLSVFAGLLLLTRPELILRGLALFIAALFFLDGIGKMIAAIRARSAGASWRWMLLHGLANTILAVVLAAQWPVSSRWIVMILVGIRMLGAGWSMLLGRLPEPAAIAAPRPAGLHPDRRLGLPAHPEFVALAKSVPIAEGHLRATNTVWCLTFILVFFAIHVGRMNVDWNLVGAIAPLVAVAGDVGTALLIAFGLVLPYRLGWRKLTRPIERRMWARLLARSDQGRGPGLVGRLERVWLMARWRFAWRMGRARRSPLAALAWGLQVGLPATAVLIAVNPIWGFNWFFNSESWTTGIWDRWAEARTDTWREAMIEAAREQYQARHIGDERLFAVEPAGVAKGDFSFLVLGDTGEGGAAQHSLRDQYLFLGQRPDVKFLIVSSDVIYPEGAMRDYEPNFYLPFKGFTKPIYAIPGNHDWYDALEAFSANFLEADAARAAMHARIEVDGRVTSTTPRHIEALIDEAARLRREYGVSTGWQRGPFFEVQTEGFALIAVDTGVIRRVDTEQWTWLKAALERARGKFILVLLGHPLYAGGRYQAGVDEPFAGEWLPTEESIEVGGYRLTRAAAPFAAVHQLLREHQVQVVMAGDTHYFEHYREPYEVAGGKHTMHHFVNGGGGAYLSIGTPLDWPARPALADSAYYPRKDVLIDKMDREMPVWKEPLWQWTRHLRAWPLTAETVAGAFTYNRAPFLQSFVEVRVEKSRGQVRLIVHGANGPLRWREMEVHGKVQPERTTGDDPVEFTIPMPGRSE